MLSRLPALLLALFSVAGVSAAERPNILWLTAEDHGPHLGCYGDPLARTPHMDALAARGLRYARAWSNVPVCAPARTAIITGLYPSSSGALHMRSMVPLPPEIRLYPELLREAGYHCTNNVKEDYNVIKARKVWDDSSATAHWRDRPAGRPFFAVFNSMASHESRIRARPHEAVTDPAAVRVPAHHPDLPEVRQDWAQYYDKVSAADAELGARLREVVEAGLADDTIVFFYADHGSGMPRHKRWAGNSGLHVPFIVHFPEKWRHLAPADYAPGGVSERLVSFVDLAPTLLSLLGLAPPEWMQGRAFAGPHQAPPPEFLFGERGRMDERADAVRTVTDGRFVYLRNFHLHTPHGQHVTYQQETPATRAWHALHAAGGTNDATSRFWRAPRDPEELYDLHEDPDEVNNLAGSPAHRAVRERLAAALRAHQLAIRDVCLLPEHELHTRAPGTPPYNLARDGGRFPLERLLDSAGLAAGFDAAAIPRLRELLGDPDGAVRHWAARGLLHRGAPAVVAADGELGAALDDPSPAVRITAAEALARHGPAPRRAAALEVLRVLASPSANGLLTALPALQAIDDLGPLAAPLAGYVRGLEPVGPSPHANYNQADRLIDRIAARAGR